MISMMEDFIDERRDEVNEGINDIICQSTRD
jgi:hypothetical protein